MSGMLRGVVRQGSYVVWGEEGKKKYGLVLSVDEKNAVVRESGKKDSATIAVSDLKVSRTADVMVNATANVREAIENTLCSDFQTA